MKKTELMDRKGIFDDALDEISAVLKRERSITDITQLAAGALNVYQKLFGSEIHQEALHFAREKLKVKTLPER